MASGMDDTAPMAAVTTITVTSFSTPAATSTSTSPPSSSPSRKFAGLATGAAIGGFALTCVLGWALFLLWKRRHPHRWHGGPSRPPADFGWRRAVASKLQETDRSEKSRRTSGSDVDKDSSTLTSPTPLTQPFLKTDDGRPGYGRQESSTPLLDLPSTTDLLRECAALISTGITPRSPADAAIASERPPSVQEAAAIVTRMEPHQDLEIASQSSHSSHHTFSSHHFAPSFHSHQGYQRGRTPSPTHRRNNSNGSITFVPNSASWHGHSNQTVQRNHFSWQGPQQQHYVRSPSWSGHSPVAYHPPLPPPLPRPYAAAPPSAWSGPPSAWAGPPPSPSRSAFPPLPPSPSQSRHSQPPSPVLPRSSPSQPKFFFNTPTVMPTPLPPEEPTPPSPPLELPRRLTVTNPDSSYSPNLSNVDLPHAPVPNGDKI